MPEGAAVGKADGGDTVSLDENSLASIRVELRVIQLREGKKSVGHRSILIDSLRRTGEVRAPRIFGGTAAIFYRTNGRPGATARRFGAGATAFSIVTAALLEEILKLNK